MRDFTEEGTIRAAAERLDYLKALGVNAVELMPVQEFEGNDSWGYNPAFYFAPDKAYGRREDYRFFIDEAHRRGMAVVLDVVFNHAAGLCPLARLYWDSAGGRPAGDNPWMNAVAPHPYSVFCDFNHEEPKVREFFKRVLGHWMLGYGVDGFRFDLSKGFTQRQSSEATAGLYDASRVAILKDYAEYIKGVNPDAYVILEHFCEDREERELAEAGMLLWNNLGGALGQAVMGYREGSGLEAGSAGGRGWPFHRLVTYGESHDEERVMYKAKTWGVGAIRDNSRNRYFQASLGGAFLLCMPGPKLVWQFGELGYDVSIEENGRTGRKPVRWDYYDDADRRQMFDFYCRLLELRAAFPRLFAAPERVEMRVGEEDWESGRSIMLERGDTAVLLAGNFTDDQITARVGFAEGYWEDVFGLQGGGFEVPQGGEVREVEVAKHFLRLFVRVRRRDTAVEAVYLRRRCEIRISGGWIVVEGDCAASYGEPHASCGEPHQLCGEPHASYGEPHASYGEPHASYGEPHQLYGEPHQLCGEPHQLCGEPHGNYGEPHGNRGEPHAGGSEGCGIVELSLYGIGGERVRSVKGCRMSLSGIRRGVYVATARTASGEVFAQKVVAP
ncbi:MAG: hypothetical protein LBR84_01490 [Tannerella sp.]|nr:hypothetical protein [Tannerella sp.]